MAKKFLLSAVVGLAVTLGAMVTSEANAAPPGNPCTNIGSWNGNVAVYTVKFTCGTQSSTDDDVVTGVYRTNINVHNPQNQTVNFCTKVVLPDNAATTGITQLAAQSLGPDHALFIDCFTSEAASIQSQLTNNSPPITVPSGEFEGFVVIEVPQGKNGALLDVEGKYTARPGGSNGSASDVSSLQVVVYRPTFLSGGNWMGNSNAER
jgi:hypothetical protein